MSHKTNHLKLKAMRQALGLTVAEACEFVPNLRGEPVSKRYLQYLEAGEQRISDEIDLIFFTKAAHYRLLLEKLTSDIESWHKDNPRPTSDEYLLALPFFYSFDDFANRTGNPSRASWRIWQSITGHLALMGKLHQLDDDAQIPDNFRCRAWLKNYD